MDILDRRIVAQLADDSKMTLRDLSQVIGLSVSPLQARIKRLEAEGVILGYAARVNHEKMDRTHIAFVQVSLTDTRGPALDAFNRAVRKLTTVEQCHMIAGGFDYLLKVRTRDIAAYREELAEHISALPYVASSSTFVSMQAIVE